MNYLRRSQEQIINKADGVPLFIEELTKTVLESELVQNVGDRYVGPLNSLAIPASLLNSLTARLTGWAPPRKSLRLAQSSVANSPRCWQLLLAARWFASGRTHTTRQFGINLH